MLALDSIAQYFFVNRDSNISLAYIHFTLVVLPFFPHFTPRSIDHHYNLLVLLYILIELLQKVVLHTIMGYQAVIVEHFVRPPHNELVHTILDL